jgi:hypothetical protein
MRMSLFAASVLLLGVLPQAVAQSTGSMTETELIAKLEAAGYSQIRDIKSTKAGISVMATKNGRDVSLVVDSSGHFLEQ